MFEKNLIAMYGEVVKIWLQNLPVLVANISDQYELRDLKPVANLSYNYVLTGFQKQNPIIVKLGLDVAGLKHEANTLEALSGFGVARVLAQEDGLLLLERAVPGITLKSYFPDLDKDATHITAERIKELHQAPFPKNVSTHTFPHIKDWLMALDNGHASIPAHYLQKARQLRDLLLQSSSSSVLLHGDLHHDNILKNNDDWIVIDPKGIIGDPTYEIAAFIRNPIPELLTSVPDPSVIIKKRIHHFAILLDIDERRIQDWCFVQSILSWIWAIEDGADCDYFQKICQIFDAL